jgi:putative MATE family efflux protein
MNETPDIKNLIADSSPVPGIAVPSVEIEPNPPQRAIFLTGSTLRHTINMTATGAVGLFALFIVDLLNIIYIGFLHDPRLTAAVGFASTAYFLLTSVGIGMSIAGTSLVSRALGRGEREKAHHIAGSFLAHSAIAGAVTAVLMALCASWFLELLGAKGETADMARVFLLISLPSVPIQMMGMSLSGLLRAVGDARRSMEVTIIGGVATALLDPLFLFVFEWGIDGVAVAANIARCMWTILAFYYCIKVHNMIVRPVWKDIRRDARAIWAIALPAVLTNIATPVANSYVTAKVSPFGDAAVAGLVMITRLVPVIFGALFALSGSIGPILGQNFGAGAIDRVRSGFSNAIFVTAVYVLCVWALMVVFETPILTALGAQGQAAELVRFFISFIALSWFFHGVLFVANASFNTLGYPLLSTAFNWGKATLGTMPFVAWGAASYGAKGALAGQAIGAFIFGIAGIIAGYYVIGRLHKKISV